MERNHTPQFSVVIPVFNRPRLVAEAIESVFAQSYKNLELLLIDDGSTDETPEVLKRYGAEARIIRQPRKGPGSARNRGLESARGNYVAFLDSDDVWFAWTLATFQWVIQRTGAPTIVMGSVLNFTDVSPPPAPASETTFTTYRDYLSSHDVEIFRGSGAAIFDRSALITTGGFVESEMYCEDMDLLLRLGTAPLFVSVTSPPILARRLHADSTIGDIAKTHSGVMYMIKTEANARYPGGKERQRQRLALITHHARAVFSWCVGAGRLRLALGLYLATALWNIRCGQFFFLTKALLQWLHAAARR